MTASNIGGEHYFVLHQPEASENAVGTVSPGSSQQRVAPGTQQPGTPAVSHLQDEMRADSCAVGVALGTIQETSREFGQPKLSPTRKEREAEIRQNYVLAEKDTIFRAGAKRLLAYLEGQQKSLAEVTKRDLEEWARTPIPTGNGKGALPSVRSFRGAQAFCAFAAQAGYLDAQRATDIAECLVPRPHIDVNVLRQQLQNPMLTSEECESHLHQNFRLAEQNAIRQGGAGNFMAYLAVEKKKLAEVTTSDLGRWALKPLTKGRGKNNLPTSLAFEGAKQLCALGAEVGYIQTQSAKDFAAYTPPHGDLDALRIVLQNPVFTRKDQDQHIRQYFQRTEKEYNRRAGASAFLTYLESQARSLAEVTTSDLGQWALTPFPPPPAKGALPNAPAFAGAKSLCAIAAEVGHIDGPRAKELAEFKRPQFALDSLCALLRIPTLTNKEREYHIGLNYQAAEDNIHRRAGATGFLAYLQSAEIPLAEVSKSDLKAWALTPTRENGGVPNAQAFEGAKALCALAAQVGHIDAQRAKALATSTRPHFDVDYLRTVLQSSGLTRKEREYQIRLNYQSLDKDTKHQSGANGFMAYLERQAKSLSEVTPGDLENWALTPMQTGKGNLPNAEAFEGAKALCVLAAEVGHIDALSAPAFALCKRPQADRASLRMLLQNPELTPKERESHIRLSYQSAEKSTHFVNGANEFSAYLESAEIPLAEVTKSDLQEWALTPVVTFQGKRTVPSLRAFKGAKALCALAAEVGYIDAQTATDLAACPCPHFEIDLLRSVLENSALTRKEREYEICLNYQSTEKSRHRQSGTNGFLAYLEKQGSSLADVTKRDLDQWARTPIPSGQAKGTFPTLPAIQGAKRLCALAAEVGYIDAQRAADIAGCTLSQPAGPATSTLTGLERVNKRLRIDDQGASTSTSHSCAFPSSDAFQRELALSRPTVHPHQDVSSSPTGSPQTLMHPLEALENMHGAWEYPDE